jgi:hypothetical protein
VKISRQRDCCSQKLPGARHCLAPCRDCSWAFYRPAALATRDRPPLAQRGNKHGRSGGRNPVCKLGATHFCRSQVALAFCMQRYSNRVTLRDNQHVTRSRAPLRRDVVSSERRAWRCKRQLVHEATSNCCLRLTRPDGCGGESLQSVSV